MPGENWYLREVRATRPIADESTGAIVATPDSHGIVVGTGLADGLLVFWTGAEKAVVTPLDAITRWRTPDAGTGDVWAAIIAELPEGAARDLAVARRDMGIARYGVPLGIRDLDTAQRDLREELLDAMAYGVECAALLRVADPDDSTADLIILHAAEAYHSATGLFYPQAIGRAVRKLARGAR